MGYLVGNSVGKEKGGEMRLRKENEECGEGEERTEVWYNINKY